LSKTLVRYMVANGVRWRVRGWAPLAILSTAEGKGMRLRIQCANEAESQIWREALLNSRKLTHSSHPALTPRRATSIIVCPIRLVYTYKIRVTVRHIDSLPLLLASDI